MEMNNLLKDVVTLNEYISATQDVTKRFKYSKVNFSIVPTLKKIRALEIEYINKFEENGVACIIFERLLTLPPSKTWGFQAKELICLLQYWLDALRNQLINNSTCWWSFLKIILRFIKDIHLKERSIPNILVEVTAKNLFELSTAPELDVFKRQEIVHCLNIVCAESGRGIRFAMRTKFGDYFVKLAYQMLTSGYLPGQYGCLVCLLRWMVRRKERATRAAAADRWLPRDLCPQRARDLFLDTTWTDFDRDARLFLNAVNEASGLVTSVICRYITIGDIVVINGRETQETWVDINCGGWCISVRLEPAVLHTLGAPGHTTWETLIIDREITECAQLRREPFGVTILIKTIRAPYFRPTEIAIFDECSASIVVSSGANLRTLDTALRNTFGDKYQLLMDLERDIFLSPPRYMSSYNTGNLISEEDTGFSNVTRRKQQSGYVVIKSHAGVPSSRTAKSSVIQEEDTVLSNVTRRKQQSGYVVIKSHAGVPSSRTAKSSVIQLRSPRDKLDKAPDSVCEEAEPSVVSEHTERDKRGISTAITLKYQPYGVCDSGLKPIKDKTSLSYGETIKPKPRGGRRPLSPVVNYAEEASLLLVATLGSADDSVINETVERLSKSKEFEGNNIINLIIQKSLQNKSPIAEVSSSGINIYENKRQEKENKDVIENTPPEKDVRKVIVPLKQNCTSVVSKSTTGCETNTEIYERQAVNKPNNSLSLKRNTRAEIELQNPKFDVNSIEEFFTKHVAENNTDKIVISPSLAKKINETSSETSVCFDDYLIVNEDVHTDIQERMFNETEVSDCLNNMVDNLKTSDEYSFKENNAKPSVVKTKVYDESNLYEGQARSQKPKSKPLGISRQKRNTKKRSTVKKPKTCVLMRTNTIEQDAIKKMSTITEQVEDNTPEEINLKTNDANKNVIVSSPVQAKNKSNSAKDTETPIVRRKRKLYSPKDNDIEHERVLKNTADVKDMNDVSLSKKKACIDNKTPKTIATFYKDLEKERKIRSRLPRSRKSKGKFIETQSPRTIEQNTIFENLKKTVENNEMVKLVDINKSNMDEYNFSSGSEGIEDFKKYRINVKKRFSTNTNNANINIESKTAKKGRNKLLNKSKAYKIKPVIELVGSSIELVDEKMREAPREELDTSILHENCNPLEVEETQPILKELPQMEEIPANDENKRKKRTPKLKILDSKESNKAVPKGNKRAKTTELLMIKKEKGIAKKGERNIPDKDDEETTSPLPELIVESERRRNEDDNESITIDMSQKIKKLYKEGPDATSNSANTQNMLSDREPLNYNERDHRNADEICLFDDTKENTSQDKNKNRGNEKTKKKQILTKRKRLKEIQSYEQSFENVIVITEPSDILSAKSIGSDGIRAHGDLEEMPPNSDTIQEKLPPREIEDLDESIKDFYRKLARKINDSDKCKSESSRSVERKEVSNILRNHDSSTRNSSISPTVLLKRLSADDISKWMPSRCSFATDTSQSVVKQKSSDATPKSTVHSTKSKAPATIKSKYPVVCITRMSSEELNKWLTKPKIFEDKTAPHQTEKLIYAPRSNSKTKRLSTTSQDLSKIDKTSSKKTTDHKSNTKRSETSGPKYNLRSKSKFSHKHDDKEALVSKNVDNQLTNIEAMSSQLDGDKAKNTKARNITEVNGTSLVTNERKNVSTMISPIRIFDVIPPGREINDDAEDNCLSYKRNLFSETKKTDSNKKVDLDLGSVQKDHSAHDLKSPKQKRKSDTPVHSVPRKTYKESKEPETVPTESAPLSIASVNDWFARTEPAPRGHAVALLKDSLQSLAENVDTTLGEISRNTSTKFMNLFVEMQNDINLINKERQEEYNQVLQAMKQLFKGLERSQAQHQYIKDRMMKLATDFITQDCKQKKTFMRLLQEDIEAVLRLVDECETAD